MRRRMLLVVMAAAVPALLAAQVPAGGEFQVNTSTAYQQYMPTVAMDADGGFVVAWASGHYYVLPSVMGQRFSAAGGRLGVELQVSDGGWPEDRLPALAMAAAGDFVVTWVSTVTHPLPLNKVLGRRYEGDGTPVGQQFATPSNLATSPAAAWLPGGGFVVVWSQYDEYFSTNADIRAQRFDSAATRVGTEFSVNTYTTGTQNLPAVAVGPGGDFLVVWQSAGQDGSGSGIFGQRFSSAALPLGAEFRVNDATALDQTRPVTAAGEGGFVVAWASDDQAGSGANIHSRRLSAAGAPLGSEMVVNTYTASEQLDPALAADAAGNFVVSWTSAAQDGSGFGIFAQRFDAAGGRRGAEFRVNTTTLNVQDESTIGSDAQGNFVVAWSSYGQDGSWDGVFAQRFGGLRPSALAIDTAGNGVFEPGESIDVRPSWGNLSGAAQTFGGSLASFGGPLPASYTIEDGAGAYGTVPDGATAACGDCYRVAVPTIARPAQHWDAVLEEKIVPDTQGQDKLWRLHLGLSFTDVPASSGFYRFVEELLHHGVTAGCGGPLYCAAAATAREQMPVFLLVAKEGGGYRPAACTPASPVFADVPADSPFCPFVEELARRGVVAGCGGGNYCPGDPVSREQMAVFVLRTLEPELVPPACSTPMFADVPASSPFCPWIEELARRGVVAGCGAGNYCPADAVTREQMAVFIGVAFNLTLYGP